MALTTARRAMDAAEMLRGDAVRRGELTAPPGLVARLEGGAGTLEAVARPPARC